MSAHSKKPWIVLSGTICAQSHPEFNEYVAVDIAANAADIVKCVNERDELLRVLRLVKRGLDSGHITSKPIIDISNLSGQVLDMRPLSLVIDAALARTEIAS